MHERLRYKVWGEPTGEGSNDQFAIQIGALAKRSRKNPFELANEMLCMRLGIALSLPVPMGFISSHDGKDYYVSLLSAITGEPLPPATDEELATIARDEWHSCGILVFDAWICNEDRGPRNIGYDDQTSTPLIFDHGSAFYDPKHGLQYFAESKNSLCLAGHCLAPLVTSLMPFSEWHRRVCSIPEHYIVEAVRRSADLGLPKDDVSACIDFLLDRRGRLDDLFYGEHAATFPALKKGDLLNPFALPPPGNYCI